MPKNLGGYMTLATPPFRKNVRGHVQTVPGKTCVKFEVRSFNRFKLDIILSHDELTLNSYVLYRLRRQY